LVGVEILTFVRMTLGRQDETWLEILLYIVYCAQMSAEIEHLRTVDGLRQG